VADVIFVAVIGAFFALCIVYIRWCDRIIGGDDVTVAVDVTPPDEHSDAEATAVRASA